MNLDTSEIFLADGWVQAELPSGWLQSRGAYDALSDGLYADMLDFAYLNDKKLYRSIYQIISVYRIDAAPGQTTVSVEASPLEVCYCTAAILEEAKARVDAHTTVRYRGNQIRGTVNKNDSFASAFTALMSASDYSSGNMICCPISELKLTPEVAKFATKNNVPLGVLLPQSKIK